jgi:hypothetical protein
MLAVLDKEASLVMAALDTSVRDAKSQLASMHLAVASCWNASMRKALAALSLSPSEFDSWLLNETQVCPQIHDVFHTLHSCALLVVLAQMAHSSRPKRSCIYLNPFVTADEWLDPLAYPRYNGQDEDRRIEVLSGGLACPRDPSEDSPDQLLRESDKATAIVCSRNIWFKLSVLFQIK